jgi:hypothetical protein
MISTARSRRPRFRGGLRLDPEINAPVTRDAGEEHRPRRRIRCGFLIAVVTSKHGSPVRVPR